MMIDCHFEEELAPNQSFMGFAGMGLSHQTKAPQTSAHLAVFASAHEPDAFVNVSTRSLPSDPRSTMAPQHALEHDGGRWLRGAGR